LAANVGTDKDGDKRQRAVIETFGKWVRGRAAICAAPIRCALGD
jgi:hypothetical protein